MIVLLDSNAWLRRVTGVDKFHAAGYFGSRVMAGTGEKVNTEGYSAGGRIIPVLGDGTSEHAIQTDPLFLLHQHQPDGWAEALGLLFRLPARHG